MTIQFLCPSCKQPIEIDSAWASKTVACPYCRGTVTAPNSSTLPDAQEIPLAAPFFSNAPRYAPTPSTNPLALVAFGLMLLMGSLYVTSGLILSAHRLEVEELVKQIEMRGSDPSARFSAWLDYSNSLGTPFPMWLIAVSTLSLAGMATCVASLVCGIIALRHRARRSLALTSVIGGGMWIGFVLLQLFGAVL